MPLFSTALRKHSRYCRMLRALNLMALWDPKPQRPLSVPTPNGFSHVTFFVAPVFMPTLSNLTLPKVAFFPDGLTVSTALPMPAGRLLVALCLFPGANRGERLGRLFPLWSP